MAKTLNETIYTSTERQFLRLGFGLMVTNNVTLAAELGTHNGGSLVYWMAAMQLNGGGTIYGIDQEAPLIQSTQDTVTQVQPDYPDVTVKLRLASLPAAIDDLPSGLEFVFVDDRHTVEHVNQELDLLLPKMHPNGLILGHDMDAVGPAFLSRGGMILPQGHGLGVIALAEGRWPTS